MRRPFMAGNWKMNKTPDEAAALAKALRRELADAGDVTVAICPPYVSIAAVRGELSGSDIALGAQDVHWEPSGAYTGAVSAGMLAGAGCKYVIVGHSERRQHFGETDETVSRRLKAALGAGLKPIMCLGETLEEREKGVTEDVVGRQFSLGTDGVGAADFAKVTMAYEPVWAIGTGRTATPAQAQEVHAFLRGLIGEKYGRKIADGIIIQYGGSVKPENVKDIMAQEDVDGALVGGASLQADVFAKIVKF